MNREIRIHSCPNFSPAEGDDEILIAEGLMREVRVDKSHATCSRDSLI